MVGSMIGGDQSTPLWGEILRKRREELKDNFIGGLFPTEYDTKIAPDLVVSKRLVRGENYLELMHSYDIAISSTGLHESIGWENGRVSIGRKGHCQRTILL